MLSSFFVLTLLVSLLIILFNKKHAARAGNKGSENILNPAPLFTAALFLGIGLGGFVDSILLHQVLQWHEMLSAKLPPVTLLAKSVNMFWDGVFHAFCLLVTIAGVVMLWKAGKKERADKSGKLLWGGLLGGWGLFNIVEGVIDHHLLKLHNVRELTENIPAWNFGFVAFSILLLGAAGALVKKHL